MSNNIDTILKTPSVAKELNGKFFYNKSIKNLSWLKAGGILEYLYIPKNENDLSILLQELIPGLELNVFGKLSNILIRDGGLSGLSILIPPEFKKITYQKQNILTKDFLIILSFHQVETTKNIRLIFLRQFK